MVELEGRLDRAALQRALTELVRRHDVLRTTFFQRRGAVEQVVAPAGKTFPLHVIYLAGAPPELRAVERARIAYNDLARGFDLGAGPLFRATLVVLDEVRHDLHLMMHHAISDSWSVRVMVRELGILYAAYTRGEASPLPELAVQYADVARWQRERLQGAVLKDQLAYWTRQLAGAPAVLRLSQARPRPAVMTYAGKSVTVTWGRELLGALKRLAEREDATLFMVLLGAFQVLMSRYSGQTDVVVGTPVANRSRPELEGLIGCFVNTLAIRTDVSGEPSFVEVLGRVKQACLEGYAHQELPFERLVEALQPERNLRYHPVYQVMFVLQNAPAEAVELPEGQLVPMQVASKTSMLDLTLAMEERSEGLTATLSYRTELYADELAGRMLEHLEVLLEEIVAAPERAVTRYRWMTAEERAQVVEMWNQGRPLDAAGMPLVTALLAALADV